MVLQYVKKKEAEEAKQEEKDINHDAILKAIDKEQYNINAS